MNFKKIMLAGALIALSSAALADDMGQTTVPTNGKKASISTNSLMRKFDYDVVCHIQNPVENNFIVIDGVSSSAYGAMVNSFSLNGVTNGGELSLQSKLKQGDNVLTITGLNRRYINAINFYNASKEQELDVICTASLSSSN